MQIRRNFIKTINDWNLLEEWFPIFVSYWYFDRLILVAHKLMIRTKYYGKISDVIRAAQRGGAKGAKFQNFCIRIL